MIKNNGYPDLKTATRYLDDYLFSNFIRKHNEKDDVLITLVGNGIGNIALFPKEKSAIVQNTIGMRFEQPKKFKYYSLLSKNNEIVKLDRGMAQPSIRQDELKNLDINLPTEKEQSKIESLMTNLDNLITLHQRKQNSFNLYKAFTKFNFIKINKNTWEQRKLANLINEYKETVTSDCTLPVLTSSKVDGVVLQEEHFGRKQNHDITGYNILPYGYCTYRNRSDGIDFTFNINKCCKMGIISKFYPVFYGNKNNINLISIILNNSKEVAREIGYTCSGTGQKVLSFLDLQKMNIIIPNRSEQDKISDLFTNLDNLITLHQRKLEKLNNIKKSMLDKMFV